jgi:hypothetical protein
LQHDSTHTCGDRTLGGTGVYGEEEMYVSKQGEGREKDIKENEDTGESNAEEGKKASSRCLGAVRIKERKWAYDISILSLRF